MLDVGEYSDMFVDYVKVYINSAEYQNLITEKAVSANCVVFNGEFENSFNSC